jgi:hypothetical protein
LCDSLFILVDSIERPLRALTATEDTPMTEQIELSYALHPLPVGRVAFRRWRWELWHGSQMLAAGWRLNPLHAQRAVRVHAVRYAHRLHGLHSLHPDVGHAPETAWHGRPVAFDWGELHLRLTPTRPQAV